MITLRKLETLPSDTRLRKIVRLLDGFIRYHTLPDRAYLAALAAFVRMDAPAAPDGQAVHPNPPANADDEAIFRYIDDLRYALRSRLNIPVGDWDMLPPAGYGPIGSPDGPPAPDDSGSSPVSAEAAGVGGIRVGIYLESIRSPFNAGSIIRTAAALGVLRIGMSPDCPPLDHPRLVRTSRGAEKVVPITISPLSALGSEWHPFIALEVGGRPVDAFRFPDRGTLLIGSEELGLSRQALDAAVETVSVRMTEVKGSMNVGVACGIALHTWYVQAQVTDLGDRT